MKEKRKNEIDGMAEGSRGSNDLNVVFFSSRLLIENVCFENIEFKFRCVSLSLHFRFDEDHLIL